MTYPKEALVIMKIVFGLMTTINIAGNTLVCVVVWKFKSMRTPMNFLIVHLAICDILVGLFFVPRRLLYPDTFHHPDGVFGEILCKTITWGNLTWLAGVASIMTMMAIAWERYNAIVHPLKIRFTKKKIRCMIIAAWLTACFICFQETWTLAYNPDIKHCEFYWDRLWSWSQKVDGLLWQTVGVLPFLVMCILYSRVIKSLWWPKVRVHFAHRFMIRSRKRITKTVVVVAVVGFLCWNPNLIYYTYLQMQPQSSSAQKDLNTVSPIFYSVSHSLIFLNSTINPFIYALQYTKFRKCVRELFSRNKRRPSQVSFGRDNFAMYMGGVVTNNNDNLKTESKTNCLPKNISIESQNGQGETVA